MLFDLVDDFSIDHFVSSGNLHYISNIVFITWDLFPGMVEVSTFPRCRISKLFTTFERKE